VVANRTLDTAASLGDSTRARRDSQLMSIQVAPLRARTPEYVSDRDEPLRAGDLAAARYVDREIGISHESATLCAEVAGRAFREGRTLVAGVLGRFAAEFIKEAAQLAQASVPEVRWPPPLPWELECDADLDEWIKTVDESLRHSERTLRWIASRPDLPALARVTFDALADACRARQQLLLACSEIDR
jgi:hypothetical protein